MVRFLEPGAGVPYGKIAPVLKSEVMNDEGLWENDGRKEDSGVCESPGLCLQ